MHACHSMVPSSKRALISGDAIFEAPWGAAFSNAPEGPRALYPGRRVQVWKPVQNSSRSPFKLVSCLRSLTLHTKCARFRSRPNALPLTRLPCWQVRSFPTFVAWSGRFASALPALPEVLFPFARPDDLSFVFCRRMEAAVFCYFSYLRQ